MKTIATILMLSVSTLSGVALADQAIQAVTGGVGGVSENTITSIENNYNLKLVYTGEGGMYLSDVDVVIKDASGKELVKGLTDGPFLLVKLEPGRYFIESSAPEAYHIKRVVTVGTTLKTVQISFPIKDNIQLGNASNPSQQVATR